MTEREKVKKLRKNLIEVAIMLPVGFAIGTLVDVGAKAVGWR